MSLPGVGPVVAASLVVRMPELGALSPGEAASLLVSLPSTTTAVASRDSATSPAAAPDRDA
jgi:hypothetical protein